MYQEANVEIGLLSSNMTHILQVMDIIVNEPIKAHTCRKHSERVVEYFQAYRQMYDTALQKLTEERTTPLWKPPKKTPHECISDVSELFSKEFQTSDYELLY